MENWHHTYFNDWSAQYNYDGYGQPIPFHEYSSLTNALGFAEPIVSFLSYVQLTLDVLLNDSQPQITFSSGQPLPIPSDTVHGVISPLVASGPFPAESSLGTATQSSFPPTVREHTESFVPMPFYSSNDRKYLKRCRQSSTPLNHRFIRFLPWGRTTKCYGGVPMNDCLVMRENSMSDADDHVFSFQAANQIIFRLRVSHFCRHFALVYLRLALVAWVR